MAGATDVRSGMLVRTPHGTKLGRVAGVEGGMMKVRRGTLLARELDVPIEDIEAIEGDEVIISAAAAELHSGRRYSLKDRPRLHLRERAAAGDPRLSGSSTGSVTVEQDTVVVSEPGNGTRVAYRESLIGVSDEDGEVRTWTVEGPLLSQKLDVERETATDDRSEEDSDRDERQPIIEPSQAEHPG